MKKIVYTSKAPEPVGPYSQAILHKDTLYVSGQIAIDPDWQKVINGTIKEETHQVIKNISAILEEAELTLDQVIKCSIFVKNMGDFDEINEVYQEYFEEAKPARETVEVSRLPKDVNIEISCIAAR